MMPQFRWILATLWLLLQLASALPASSELLRVPRHVWDTDTVKRDEDASSVLLADHEEFVWASTNEPNQKAVVVSMVAYAKQDERILDMDKFSFALASASCNADDMSFTFKHRLIYSAAKIAWQWVNYNDLRSFVLVPSWKGCGEDKSTDPWVVSKVQFEDKTQKVVLTATKSTWKKVMNTFVLDFGEVVLGGGKTKRDIIPDLDEKFTLDIGATLPTKIFEWKVRQGLVNGTLTANCNDCGTSGQLVFAGHVEASLGWTGVDIDKFEISVKPQSVQAHVGLSLDFVGELDFRGLVSPSEEITLLEIPVSGWNIPGIFEFGPRIQLNAGYVIDYIGGEASIGTGITATIPDTAIAKLDLLAEDSVQVSGWIPEIETDPLEIVAQIDAQARLYTEIALSVSLTVLDDNGFGVDLAFKIPEVTVTAAGGYVSAGFCPNNANPWGVSLEADVGVDLSLEGWKELDGDKDKLFGVTLFETDDLYEFPELCLSFDDVSEGYCAGEEEDDDDDDDDDDDALDKRSEDITPTNVITTPSKTSVGLVSRQNTDSSRKPYYVSCDGSKSSPISVLRYPGPGEIRLDTDVPIIKPKATCGSRESNCPPEATGLDVVTSPETARAFVQDDTDSPSERRRWSTEHIYEGNWVRDYLNHLQTISNFAPSGDTCNANLLQFWTKQPPASFTPPAGASAPKSYIEALMQQLGTELTFKERMVLLPMTQNNHKHRMFAKQELRAKIMDPSTSSYHHGHRWCDLARIIGTCKYYAVPEVQKALIATVKGLEKVLAEMDADPNVVKPSGSTFVEEHVTFYNKLYKDGIIHGRKMMKKYAAHMVQDTAGMERLDDDVQDEVEKVNALQHPDDGDDHEGWKDHCPFQPREDWPA